MNSRTWLIFPLACFLTNMPLDAARGDDATGITWKKTQLDKVFRSEGVAVGDINKDGKADILTGEVWYEAPDWFMREVRPPSNFKDGAHGYSKSFACWTDDINTDGWLDVVVVGFPGQACHWYENMKNKPGHWNEHLICNDASNETTNYADLFGTGKRVLIMGTHPDGKEGQMCWFAPDEKNPTAPWIMHSISGPGAPKAKIPGTDKFSHGLGVGDINGDGRPDVLVTAGWWEQPEKDDGKPWKFHKTDLGPLCADMFAYDVDGDGKADVVSSSAHNYGIWWRQQKSSDKNEPSFVQNVLFEKIFSQSHALHCVDINGDGQKDLVTGKRFWAHGPKGDVAAGDPAVIYWFEAKKAKDGIVTFIPHEIDNDSGIGTQFTVADVNGDKLPDIVVSNKKGTFLIEQVRKSPGEK